MSKNLSKLFGSIEFKAFLTLVVIMAFLGFLFLDYNSKRLESVFEELNQTCIVMGESLHDYFNETSNITCDCYYDPVTTGVEELDRFTKPLCSCDCLKDGAFARIAIRAV